MRFWMTAKVKGDGKSLETAWRPDLGDYSGPQVVVADSKTQMLVMVNTDMDMAAKLAILPSVIKWHGLEDDTREFYEKLNEQALLTNFKMIDELGRYQVA